MSPVGLGAGGAVGIAHETTMGTYVAPTVWVPILNEALAYTEDKYVSEAIQQQTIASDVKHASYHVEGDMVWEVDAQFAPYLMHASRSVVTKTGTGPYVYKYVPSSGASSGIGAGAATTKTMSVTVIRNGIAFKYVGVVLGGYTFTIENGVLQQTMNLLGLGEVSATDVTAVGSVVWPSARSLYGMDAHVVSIGAAGASPTFAPVTNFNGFTFTETDNAEAQNRINSSRQAAYISYGMTEATVETELDFVDRVDYDHFTALDTRAIRLKSSNSVSDYAQITVNRAYFDTYEIGLGAAADLIMAGTTAKAIVQAGGSPFDVTLGSTLNLT